MPIGWLYATYHLSREPGNSIDSRSPPLINMARSLRLYQMRELEAKSLRWKMSSQRRGTSVFFFCFFWAYLSSENPGWWGYIGDYAITTEVHIFLCVYIYMVYIYPINYNHIMYTDYYHYHYYQTLQGSPLSNQYNGLSQAFWSLLIWCYCWWFRNPANQYLQGFLHSITRWCRILSMNSSRIAFVDVNLVAFGC